MARVGASPVSTKLKGSSLARQILCGIHSHPSRLTLNKTILVLIRTVFGIASRVAPKLSGRAAFRLFCTTFETGQNSSQRKSILENAQGSFSTAIQHDIAYSGGTIAAFEFHRVTADSSSLPKTAWLVHGWQSHSLFMNKFVEPLLQQGFRVICIDLPGHGQSSGRTFHLPLAVTALHAVRGKLGEFDVVLSHSLGGAVVATALAGTIPGYPALPVSKLVMISPPDSMSKLFNDFSSIVGLSKDANDELHASVTRITGKVTDDFSTGLQLQTVSASLLIMHAPDDKEVPYSESESIVRSNPEALLKPMEGLGHRRIIASDDVVKAAVSFIAN